MKFLNTFNIGLSLFLIASFSSPIRSLDIRFDGLNCVTAVPTENAHLDLLRHLRQSNSGLIFCNGLPEELGESVEFLATASALDFYSKQFNDAHLDNVTVTSDDVELNINRISSTTSPSLENQVAAPTADSFSFLNVGKSHSLIPVQNIKGTTLFSGLFYRVGMKQFPTGWVTWTESKTVDQQNNYVQIDINPNNLPHYKETAKWDPDVQWAFTPAKDGSYNLRNKQDLSALTTVVQEKEGGYNYVILKRSQNQSLSNSDSQSWTPSGTSEDGLYQLKTSAFPEGTVTWTETKYGDHSHYLQVSTNPNHKSKYSSGAEWYNDTLFHFIPPKVELTGRISHFEIAEQKDKFLQGFGSGTKRTIVKQVILHNRGPYTVIRNVTDTIKIQNELALTFNENMKQFGSVKGTLSLPTLTCEPLRVKFELKSNTDSLEGIKNSHQFLVDSQIEILPGTSTRVSFYVDKVEGVEIPFQAMMTVKGQTDRIAGDYSGVQKGSAPNDLVQVRLGELGFEAVSSTKVVTWVDGSFSGEYTVDVGIVSEVLPLAYDSDVPTAN